MSKAVNTMNCGRKILKLLNVCLEINSLSLMRVSISWISRKKLRE